MVIHALSEAPPARAERLRSILADSDPTDEDILVAIDVIREAGAVGYSRNEATALADEARAAIAPLDLEPGPAETLRAFPSYMIERQH